MLNFVISNMHESWEPRQSIPYALGMVGSYPNEAVITDISI